MIRKEDIYPVGKFQRTHALKGELNMILEIDPQYFLNGNPLIIEYDGILVPYYVEGIRPKGNTSYLIKLSGIDKEESALPFVNKEIFISSEDAGHLVDADEMDTIPYLGYKLIDINTGKEIGEIVDIEDSTVNALFILKGKEDKEIFIPAVEDLIEFIDDKAKLIKMNVPEGLIELN